MHKDEVFPSPWLKASDLGEQERSVTISVVTLEDIGEEREKKAAQQDEDCNQDVHTV